MKLFCKSCCRTIIRLFVLFLFLVTFTAVLYNHEDASRVYVMAARCEIQFEPVADFSDIYEKSWNALATCHPDEANRDFSNSVSVWALPEEVVCRSEGPVVATDRDIRCTSAWSTELTLTSCGVTDGHPAPPLCHHLFDSSKLAIVTLKIHPMGNISYLLIQFMLAASCIMAMKWGDDSDDEPPPAANPLLELQRITLEAAKEEYTEEMRNALLIDMLDELNDTYPSEYASVDVSHATDVLPKTTAKLTKFFAKFTLPRKIEDELPIHHPNLYRVMQLNLARPRSDDPPPEYHQRK